MQQSTTIIILLIAILATVVYFNVTDDDDDDKPAQVTVYRDNPMWWGGYPRPFWRRGWGRRGGRRPRP